MHLIRLWNMVLKEIFYATYIHSATKMVLKVGT